MAGDFFTSPGSPRMTLCLPPVFSRLYEGISEACAYDPVTIRAQDLAGDWILIPREHCCIVPDKLLSIGNAVFTSIHPWIACGSTSLPGNPMRLPVFSRSCPCCPSIRWMRNHHPTKNRPGITFRKRGGKPHPCSTHSPKQRLHMRGCGLAIDTVLPRCSRRRFRGHVGQGVENRPREWNLVPGHGRFCPFQRLPCRGKDGNDPG